MTFQRRIDQLAVLEPLVPAIRAKVDDLHDTEVNEFNFHLWLSVAKSQEECLTEIYKEFKHNSVRFNAECIMHKEVLRDYSRRVVKYTARLARWKELDARVNSTDSRLGLQEITELLNEAVAQQKQMRDEVLPAAEALKNHRKLVKDFERILLRHQYMMAWKRTDTWVRGALLILQPCLLPKAPLTPTAPMPLSTTAAATTPEVPVCSVTDHEKPAITDLTADESLAVTHVTQDTFAATDDGRLGVTYITEDTLVTTSNTQFAVTDDIDEDRLAAMLSTAMYMPDQKVRPTDDANQDKPAATDDEKFAELVASLGQDSEIAAAIASTARPADQQSKRLPKVQGTQLPL